MEGRQSRGLMFCYRTAVEKATLERLVRARENVLLRLGGIACKGEVKTMELKQSEGPFAGVSHLFIDSALEAAALEINPV